MDDAVAGYLAAIAPEHRPLFDRVHALILTAQPDAALSMSYGMPTYTVGKRRFHLGVWRHGLSLYGVGTDRDGGFSARHPELVEPKGTIKVRLSDAAGIEDDEFRSLAVAALAP
jgi:uncharacterized protein YdhG (YjbR/CyaY superfamily)